MVYGVWHMAYGVACGGCVATELLSSHTHQKDRGALNHSEKHRFALVQIPGQPLSAPKLCQFGGLDQQGGTVEDNWSGPFRGQMKTASKKGGKLNKKSFSLYFRHCLRCRSMYCQRKKHGDPCDEDKSKFPKMVLATNLPAKAKVTPYLASTYGINIEVPLPPAEARVYEVTHCVVGCTQQEAKTMPKSCILPGGSSKIYQKGANGNNFPRDFVNVRDVTSGTVSPMHTYICHMVA